MNRTKKDSGAGDDGLEELESDAILAQESAAHAPQRRANVQVVEPSVVIAEQANAPARRRRGSNEKTLVIRDRRAVEEVRRKIAEDQKRRERARRLRVISLWVLGGLAAFGLGSAIAWYFGDETPASPSAQPSAAHPPIASQIAPTAQQAPPPSSNEASGSEILDLDKAAEAAAVPTRSAASDTAVTLDQLPVEKTAHPPPPRPPRKRSSPVTDQVPF